MYMSGVLEYLVVPLMQAKHDMNSECISVEILSFTQLIYISASRSFYISTKMDRTSKMIQLPNVY